MASSGYAWVEPLETETPAIGKRNLTPHVSMGRWAGEAVCLPSESEANAVAIITDPLMARHMPYILHIFNNALGSALTEME